MSFKMLFKKDSLHGHVIVDTPAGAAYEDDGTLVNGAHPRPCKGCNAHVEPGGHDPCIAELPGTHQACCGHGLDRSPRGNLPNGYVALKNGRCFRFSGLCGGKRIREAVDAALSGNPLPEGFQFDDEKLWWEGLTDAQRNYVHQNMTRGLHSLVEEARPGTPAPVGIITGEQMWYEGLDEEEKPYVMSCMKAMLAELVQEALAAVP